MPLIEQNTMRWKQLDRLNLLKMPLESELRKMLKSQLILNFSVKHVKRSCKTLKDCSKRRIL